MIITTTDLKDDDIPAFSELYRLHAGWMLRYAEYILKNRQDAEDAVQECFLYLAGHFHYVRGKDEKSVRSALLVLTKSRSLNVLRGRREHADLEEADVGCPGDEVRVLEGMALEEAIAALPPAQREVFLLHAADGYSLWEIAGLRSMRYDAVRKTWQRARQALKQYLSGE